MTTRCRWICLLGWLVGCGPVLAARQLDLVSQVDRVDVVVDGQILTSFRFNPNLPKPVLFPIKSLSGITVTRGFPLDPMPGESQDHPHHMGLSFNYGYVNDDVFWPDQKPPTAIRLNKIDQIMHQDNQGTLAVTLVPGEAAHFRFQVLVLDGPEAVSRVKRRYTLYAASQPSSGDTESTTGTAEESSIDH